MALDKIPLFAVLKSKMNWHQTRQTLLAQNVANADTPNYKGRDLAPFRVEQALQGGGGLSPLAVSRTSARHIEGHLMSEADSGFAARAEGGWEITPEGNGVVLEEQMMKVTTNAYDYQVASTLYARSLGLLKTAIRGRS